MSHTPGPWFARKATHGPIDIVVEDGRDIVTLYGSENKEANSHLIAAAPDMFDALKPFAEAVENLHDDHPDSSHIWESPAAMSLTAGDFRRALAALTKAQGLSPEREAS